MKFCRGWRKLQILGRFYRVERTVLAPDRRARPVLQRRAPLKPDFRQQPADQRNPINGRQQKLTPMA